MSSRPAKKSRMQSSLELLITLSLGLTILLPIVTLAFLQISTSSSALSSTEAQSAAEKIAAIAAQVGAQGYPAKQLITLQVPQNVQAIYIGNLTNGLGNEVIFVVNTNAGLSYVTAYTPVNISGYLVGIQSPATYLINVSAQVTCPSKPSFPCVYVSQVMQFTSTSTSTTSTTSTSTSTSTPTGPTTIGGGGG